jgi:hypothetical protein
MRLLTRLCVVRIQSRVLSGSGGTARGLSPRQRLPNIHISSHPRIHSSNHPEHEEDDEAEDEED